MLGAVAPVVGAPPADFVQETIGGTFVTAAGALFLPDGALLVWELDGRIWRVEVSGARSEAPLLDIRDEVGRWGDHGLVGAALHPNFQSNGFVYLLYAVDRHHLLHAGTPSYDPAVDQYRDATIARITRYRVRAEDGWRTIDASSRRVIVGASISDGLPVFNMGHGEGSLLFGQDGTLLVSLGDNASPQTVDVGGAVKDGWPETALADGIIGPLEQVGAFRAQSRDSLCGKILRLDADSGDGVRSNPWWDETAPRSARSRIWSTGLRNAFRMTRLPESGSHHPDAGDPGLIFAGDVGWDEREELDLVTGPGRNFGWPMHEGITSQTLVAPNAALRPYPAVRTTHPGVPAAPDQPCPVAFQDLVATDASQPDWVIGCSLSQAEGNGGLIFVEHGGYAGAGYYDFQQASGERLTIPRVTTAAGSNTLFVRYALGTGPDRALRLLVDGARVAASVAFPATGRWDRWAWLAVPLTTTPGEHELGFETIGQNGPNIDGIAIAAAGAPNPALSPASLLAHRAAHTPPVLDWVHLGRSGTSPRVPQPLNGLPWRGIPLTTFSGNCVVAGPWIDHASWPEAWRNRLYVADYAGRWIRALQFDAGRTAVTAVTLFDGAAGSVLWLDASPVDGNLYVARASELVRIRPATSGNRSPVIRCASGLPHGPAPLEVRFDASASADPDGDALSFAWDFGDGSTATGPIVTHRFGVAGGAPSRVDVRLTVRDARSAVAELVVPVWPGNRPPEVALEFPREGQRYDASNPLPLPVDPTIFDPDGQAVACRWELTLLHDSHSHPWGGPATCAATLDLEPTPCAGSAYAYLATLTATDSLGLSTSVSRTLRPRCVPCRADLDGSDEVDFGDIAVIMMDFGAGVGSSADLDGSGIVDFGDAALAMLEFGPCA